MKEPTKNESISAAIEALNKEFESKQKDGESDDALGAALLDFILERERIRRGIASGSPYSNQVDQETLETLRTASLEDPNFALPEAVFRRLGNAPSEAIRYLTSAVEQRSERMSQIARQPRPSAINPFGEIIDEIVERYPQITRNELLQKLKKNEDLHVFEGKILFKETRHEMQISGLSQALNRSKKRINKKNSR